MYKYICMYKYIYMCIYKYISISVSVYICVYIYVSLYVYLFIWNTHSKKPLLYIFSLSPSLPSAAVQVSDVALLMSGMQQKPVAVPGANPQFHAFFTLKCPFLAFAVFFSALHFGRIMSEKGEEWTLQGKKYCYCFQAMTGSNSIKEMSSPFKMKMYKTDELPSTHRPQHMQGFFNHFQGGDVTFARTILYLKIKSFKKWF